MPDDSGPLYERTAGLLHRAGFDQSCPHCARGDTPCASCDRAGCPVCFWTGTHHPEPTALELAVQRERERQQADAEDERRLQRAGSDPRGREMLTAILREMGRG